MNNKITTKYLLLRFLLVMLSVVFVGNMLAIRGITIPLRNLQYSLTFACFFCVAISFVLGTATKSKPIITNTFYFIILISVVTFFSYLDNNFYALFNIMTKALFWAMSLVVGYSLAYKNELAVKKSVFVAFFLPIFFFLFVLAKDYLINEAENTAMITSAYYLLCLLPFVFLLKSNIIKIIFSILTGLAILMSAKRTGFIAYSLAITVYVFVDIMIRKNVRFKMLRYLFLMSILTYIVVYVVRELDLTIFDRLQSIAEDGGSGRTSAYESTWELIKQSDLLNFFFGRGFNRVYADMGLNLSAHTDFLEVLYDYGAIGFIMYLNMYAILIKYAHRLWKEKSEYAASFMSAIVIMLILSAFSHLIIFNTYFIYLCFFFGLVSGDYDRREMERLCLK